MECARAIGGAALFKGLTANDLDQVCELARTKGFKSGEVIFSEGSYGDEVCLVLKGMVRVELAVHPKADFTTIHRFSEGQVFGELSLADRRNRSATVACETDCEILTLSCKDLLALFDRNRHLGYVVMGNLAALLSTRLRETNSRLISAVLLE